MKSRTRPWTLALLALALCSAPATASSIGFFVSSYSPDDTDTREGVGLDLEFGSGPVEFEIRAAYYTELVSKANPEIFELEAVPVDFGLNRSFGGGGKITPYVGGGFTYAVFDFVGDVTVAPGVRRAVAIDAEFGFYAQAGFEFDIGKNWEGSVEGLFRQLDAEPEGDDLGTFLDQPLSMSGPAFNVGLAVHW